MKDIGNDTAKLIMNPHSYFSKQLWIKPGLIRVRIEDMENDIDKDIDTLHKKMELFCLSSILAHFFTGDISLNRFKALGKTSRI